MGNRGSSIGMSGENYITFILHTKAPNHPGGGDVLVKSPKGGDKTVLGHPFKTVNAPRLTGCVMAARCKK